MVECSRLKTGGRWLSGSRQGERGRHRGKYQIWSTDTNGQINKSSWINGNTMAQEGYETTFNKDLDGDKVISAPSDSNLWIKTAMDLSMA